MDSANGDEVIIQGVELGHLSVPLHNIILKLVGGPVTIGVRLLLPVKGVTVILGNDLAGSRVRVVYMAYNFHI